MGEQKPAAITEPKLVLVEGKDEVNFFSALKASLGLEGIQIMDTEGKYNLANKAKAVRNAPGFTQVVSLAVVRDANSNASGAFRSVQDALRVAELPVPKRPLEAEGDRLRVIAMILPHGAASGMLEDVCLEAVVNDPAMQCVESYFRCIREQGTEFPRNLSKAKVHAFLASRPEPDKRLGEAALDGYWPWDAPAFGAVKQLLQML